MRNSCSVNLTLWSGSVLSFIPGRGSDYLIPLSGPAGPAASGAFYRFIIETVNYLPGPAASSAFCWRIGNVNVTITVAYITGGTELNVIYSLSTAPGTLYHCHINPLRYEPDQSGSS